MMAQNTDRQQDLTDQAATHTEQLKNSPAYQRWLQHQQQRGANEKLMGLANDPTPHTFACLCCKDNGIIAGRTIREYIDEFYQRISVTGEITDIPSNLADAAYLCTRCSARMQAIETNSGIVRVSKWNPTDLVVLDEYWCNYIHDQELQKLRATAAAKEQAEAMRQQVEERYAALLQKTAMPAADSKLSVVPAQATGADEAETETVPALATDPVSARLASRLGVA